MNDLFTCEQLGMTVADFDEAMRGLIAKGLAEPVIVGDKTYYRLTIVGQQVGGHLTSNPEDRN
jgi:hypothetical protein